VAGRGRFVVFEGGEGTGKSTQAERLALALQQAGRAVVLGREPGGPPSAELLRQLLLRTRPAGGWEPESEALLHYAARAEHLRKVIAPALAAGTWVVCDRFADSTEAYQGAGLALNPELLHTLRRLVVGDLEPDLILVLDLDPAAGLERAGCRPGRADHYERMDLDFHQRVRAAFLDIARRGGDRYSVINAAEQVEAVQAAVLRAVERHLGLRLEP
jgi:dTMP kinase